MSQPYWVEVKVEVNIEAEVQMRMSRFLVKIELSWDWDKLTLNNEQAGPSSAPTGLEKFNWIG